MHLNLGALYAEQGQELKALDNLLLARRVAGEIDNKTLSMFITVKLSTVYKRLRDLNQARQYLKEAEAYYKAEEKPRSLGAVYKHMANLHLEEAAYDSALAYARNALEQYKPIQASQGMADSYRLLGAVYLTQNEIAISEKYLDSAMNEARGKYRVTELSTTLTLADLRLKQGEFGDAIALATQFGEDAEEKYPDGGRYKQAMILYKAYKAQGDFRLALKNKERAAEIKDSVYSQDMALEIARREYEDRIIREEALQKAERTRQNLLYQQERARDRWYLYSAIGALLLIGLLAYSFYRSNRTKKRDNKILSSQNETIASYNSQLLAMNESIAAKNKELQAMNGKVAEKNRELQLKNTELSELREKEIQHQQFEKELMEESLAVKEREMAATAMVTHEKNAILSNLEKKLAELETRAGSLKPEVEELRKSVLASLNMKDSWDSFVHKFETVHPDFFSQLKTSHPDLTLNDLKISAYIKVGMGNKEIAQATNLALSTVKKSINRLKKKLGLAPDDSVRDYLMFNT
ncbi:hypothetical protein AB9P05_22425 [Roseivirga sp. BDSF3-8]|uniref:tetratricopeptide repeat protein n=1 Tax=Roseivirga sp. BDSF3-8 TaxID=3241598 RepID=UPI003532226D